MRSIDYIELLAPLSFNAFDELLSLKMIHLDPLDLEIPSVLEKVEPVHQQVISYLNSTKCSDELHERAELAIIEALTNAIRHGNRENQEKLVRLRLFVEDTTLTCTVEDEGHGFQPEEIMNPLDPDQLLETGGRGVFLIKEMADLVIFENSGRRVRLVFREKT